MRQAGEQDGSLWAISPLDGRYRAKLDGLEGIVSEAGLIRFRVAVEAHWLLHLAETPGVRETLRLPAESKAALLELTTSLPESGARRVKDIERTTNHDVKAVEYYLRERLRESCQDEGALTTTLAFIHFAATSEDINNLAYALMLRETREKRLLPAMDRIVADLAAKAELYAELPMMSRTHGQTASPTTLGKELAVFARRLWRQRQKLAALELEGKMNGAVGNYNAHLSAFPEVDWPKAARDFVEKRLGLALNPLTTQIENHDSVVEMAAVVGHFNAILIGLCRDIWGYVSLGYFRQQAKAGEVGSSTMPHKVNPIDFENAEGNLGVANALAQHFRDKLPISRWQRDLSDSTVLRALGTLFGHSELAYRSLLTGLGKITADERRLGADLDQAFEVLAEPVQTVMRRYGVVDAYERLKAATRGQSVTHEGLLAVIDACEELPEAERRRLKAMTPAAYTGLASRLAREWLAELGAAMKGSGPGAAADRGQEAR